MQKGNQKKKTATFLFFSFGIFYVIIINVEMGKIII